MPSKSKYRIALLVDHKWRDLPGYVLLKRILEEKYNSQVCLYPTGWDRQIIPQFKPHLVLLVHLNLPITAQLAKWIKAHNSLVGLLPTEGIPSLEDEQFLRFAGGGVADLGPVDFIFSWSEEMKSKIASWGVFPSNQIYVMGAPRFDYHHPSFHSLRTPKDQFQKKYGLNPNFPTITFATNFTYADMPTEMALFHLTAVGLDQKTAEQYINNNKQSRKMALSNISRFLAENHEFNFIFKPHPSEANGIYLNLIQSARKAGNLNSHLVYKEYIWDVLASSDILLQRNCTTAVEAWIHNIPTFELRFNPEESYVHKEREAGCDIINNYDQLISRMKWYLSGKPLSPEQLLLRKSFLDKWCGPCDGNRTENLAQLLVSILDSKVKGEPHFSIPEHVRAKTEGFIKKWMPRGRPKIKTKNGYLHLDKHMTSRDLSFWTQKLSPLTSKLPITN